MNEITRYDQELAGRLQHIPMPGEEAAWTEMEKLLDKDDDDPVPVPFYRTWGCMLLAALLALLIAGGGWWYFAEKNTAEKPVLSENGKRDGKIDPAAQNKGSQPDNDTVKGSSFNSTMPDNLNTGDPAGPVADGPSTSANDKNRYQKNGEEKNGRVNERSTVNTNTSGTHSISKKSKIKKGGKTRISSTVAKTEGIMQAKDKSIVSTNMVDDNEDGNMQDDIPGTVEVKPSDTATKKSTGQADSLPAKKPATQKPTVTETGEETKKEDDKINFTYAAGVSIYQPLKLNGEPSVPYNFYGRKGTLADYIPAPHFRVYHKKWYLHTEFRYGAPQYVKPFDYKQIVLDSTATNYTRANFQLRKTYYQQVPLSVHYYVLPNLSVGTGFIFNRFKGALVDKNTYKRIGSQGQLIDTLLSSELIHIKKESSFSTNHFQWSAEVNYNWKRFFIGARYSRDIDPFIKYDDISTGAGTEKKIQALNIFLRYDLWRSKRKKTE